PPSPLTSFFSSPHTSLVSRPLVRYTKIFLAFLISGLIHLYSDRTLGIPPRDSGDVTFFSLQPLGLMIEHGVQGVYRWASGTRKTEENNNRRGNEDVGPKIWQRALGYIWLAAFLLWSSLT